MIEKFEVKLINATEFIDYLGLLSKPMFLNIDEKKKNQNITLGEMSEHNLGLFF